jgi:hypothetical protein
MIDSAKFVSRLSSMIDSADYALNKFKEKFAKDPDYAFEWATDAVEAAATMKVARGLVDLIQRPDETAGWTMEQVHHYLTEQVRRRSTRVESSTSPMSNLTERMRLKAMAEVLELMEGF